MSEDRKVTRAWDQLADAVRQRAGVPEGMDAPVFSVPPGMSDEDVAEFVQAGQFFGELSPGGEAHVMECVGCELRDGSYALYDQTAALLKMVLYVERRELLHVRRYSVAVHDLYRAQPDILNVWKKTKRKDLVVPVVFAPAPPQAAEDEAIVIAGWNLIAYATAHKIPYLSKVTLSVEDAAECLVYYGETPPPGTG